MVDRKSGELKIIDFGTAKDARNPKLDEIVEKGPVRQSFVNYVGTPQFMSPECICLCIFRLRTNWASFEKHMPLT